MEDKLIGVYLRVPEFFSTIIPENTTHTVALEIVKTLSKAYVRGYLNMGCIPPKIEYPMQESYGKEFIDYGRRIILNQIVTTHGENPLYFDESTIRAICEMYFHVFIGEKPENLSYAIAKKRGKGIGRCVNITTGDSTEFKIVLIRKMITSFFNSDTKPVVVNGIVVYNRAQLIQIVIEHELVHYMINKSKITGDDKKIYGDHGKLFKDVCLSYFGHTKAKGWEFYEEVPKFELNQIVTFTYKNKEHSGEIIKLNTNTAKVQIDAGDVYKEYDVPYHRLK